MGRLDNKKIAILSADGFEEVELTSPRDALKDAGAKVEIVSLKKGKIKSWKDKNWNMEIDVDQAVSDVSASDYDGLMLPGGVINPDLLRRDDHVINFVREFFEQGKPVAAICHGPWTLVEAGVVEGRTMTSFKSIKTDLINAGANWVDQEVVVDQGLTTSRNPNDLPAFNDKMIEEFAEGVHEGQKTV